MNSVFLLWSNDQYLFALQSLRRFSIVANIAHKNTSLFFVAVANLRLAIKMDELRAAISFNSHGVYCLETNNIVQAMHAFQNSIQGIKQGSRMARNVFHSAMEPPKDLQSRNLPVKDNVCPIHFSTRIEGLQNGLYHTFDRAMIIRPTLLHFVNNDNFDSIIYLTTVVVLFNLALTTHMHAIKYGRSQSLQHAIQLYRLAGTMTSDGDIYGNVGNVVLWLTMNNTASLHYELCDYGKCTIDLRNLQKILNDDVDVDIFTSILFDLEELNELTLNFFYLYEPIAAQAA